MGRWDEAIALLDEAVLDRPTDSAAWVLRGHVLREIGRPAEAIDAYRRAISLRPDASEAYWSLANMKTVRFSDAELGAMRELLARTFLKQRQPQSM